MAFGSTLPERDIIDFWIEQMKESSRLELVLKMDTKYI